MSLTLTSCFNFKDKCILDCVETGQEPSQGVEEVGVLLGDRRLLDNSEDQVGVLVVVTWSFVTNKIYLFMHF